MTDTTERGWTDVENEIRGILGILSGMEPSQAQQEVKRRVRELRRRLRDGGEREAVERAIENLCWLAEQVDEHAKVEDGYLNEALWSIADDLDAAADDSAPASEREPECSCPSIQVDDGCPIHGRFDYRAPEPPEEEGEPPEDKWYKRYVTDPEFHAWVDRVVNRACELERDRFRTAPEAGEGERDLTPEWLKENLPRDWNYRIHVRGVGGVTIRAWDYEVPETEEFVAEVTQVDPRETRDDRDLLGQIKLGLERLASRLTHEEDDGE